MYILPKEMWKVRTRDGDLKVVTVKCPNCANWSYLDHQVDDFGVASPSLVCDWKGCNFHEYVTLQGWTPKLMEV